MEIDPETIAGSASGTARSTLQSLDDVRPLYMLPDDPLAEEVLIPGFRAAGKVDCMAGFFSSKALAELAPGLASYVAESENSLRLIISPLLSADDQAAIEEGVRTLEEVADRTFEELTITEDLIQRHTLKCLSWLLQNRRIEIRIALVKDALFHPKVWLFQGESEVVAVHGSSNMTSAGLRKNIEQVMVSRSWQDPNQRYTTDKLSERFERLWDDKNEGSLVIGLPDAVRQRILRTYNAKSPPSEDELRALYRRASGSSEVPQPFDPTPAPPREFAVPSSLQYEDGPFRHQGEAVAEWCAAEYRGVLEMATGSGKTITAMIAAHRLYEAHKPLLVVIAVPHVPLIEQWCNEISPFGLQPLNLRTAGGAAKRTRKLQTLSRRLRSQLSDVEAVVVSHNTLCTREFLAAVNAFKCKRLLIADEVHNLGRQSFIKDPPEFFEYRLGLSATPIRQYDEEGTDTLLDFFGPISFRFTLEEAIGRCLVEYDYYVHPVYLTETEMDEWIDLTGRVKQNAWRAEGSDPDQFLAKLLRDRRAVLETASRKVSMLGTLLDRQDTDQLRHTLVYTSDKGPDQLKQVNRLLREKNILFRQLTTEETASRDQATRMIKSFQDGEIQVLTAKRVLDEGVNIPQVRQAFILASTTIERQWVQRRGRLLRKCDAIGKVHSTIHDLLALPPGMGGDLDPDARALVRSELLRAQEFARLARNSGRSDGPLATIDKMSDAAYL